MRTYADALALPTAVGGPNEGADNFADGRGTGPSFETHKSDLSVPDGYMSRLEKLRQFAHRRAVRVIAAGVFTLGATVACAGQQRAGGETAATAEATPSVPGTGAESIAPDCYGTFETLDAAGQEECRALIAAMEVADVNKLQGLDEARWASYYRHATLGERGVLQNVVRTGIIDDPSGAEGAALQFLTGYQGSMYRLAWLMQHEPDKAKDPRTLHALLGTDATDTDQYKMAAFLAEHVPSEGQSADDYIKAAGSAGGLFTSLFAENIKVKPDGDQRVLSFTAEMQTVSGTPRRQTFTYILHPYMEAHNNGNGPSLEKPDDPNAPGAELFAKLGKALLAGPAQISDATT